MQVSRCPAAGEGKKPCCKTATGKHLCPHKGGVCCRSAVCCPAGHYCKANGDGHHCMPKSQKGYIMSEFFQPKHIVRARSACLGDADSKGPLCASVPAGQEGKGRRLQEAEAQVACTSLRPVLAAAA